MRIRSCRMIAESKAPHQKRSLFSFLSISDQTGVIKEFPDGKAGIMETGYPLSLNLSAPSQCKKSLAAIGMFSKKTFFIFCSRKKGEKIKIIHRLLPAKNDLFLKRSRSIASLIQVNFQLTGCIRFENFHNTDKIL